MVSTVKTVKKKPNTSGLFFHIQEVEDGSKEILSLDKQGVVVGLPNASICPRRTKILLGFDLTEVTLFLFKKSISWLAHAATKLKRACCASVPSAHPAISGASMHANK